MGSASAGVGSGLPDQTSATAGWGLLTDGTTAYWAAVAGGSGVTTMGTFGSAPDAKGATISGVTLTMQPADGTNPGMVSTAAQTIAGVKTFSDVPVAAGLTAPTTTGLTLSGHVTDGANAVSIHMNAATTLTTVSTVVAAVENNATPYFNFRTTGALEGAKAGSLWMIGRDPTDAAGGFLWLTFGNTSATTSNYALLSDGTNTIMNAPSGNIYWRFGGAGGGPFLSSTVLDLTGLGTSGAIKMKSPDGTTYTLTVANGGAWAHSP